MRLGELQQEVVPFTVLVGGGEIKGMVRPRAYTPRLESQLAHLESQLAPSVGLAQALSKLLVDWDVTSDDGAPVPLTEESLMEVPVSVLAEMFKGVAAAISPKARNAVNSDNG